jgi:hypothetical protein
MRALIDGFGVLLVIPACLLLSACSANANRAVEKPITISAATAKTPEQALPVSIEPPTPEEVEKVVAHLFNRDVSLMAGPRPFVLVGDFNGDNSLDLAVAVRPESTKLDEINAELANWTVQDPRRAYVPPRGKSVEVLPPAPKPEKAKAGENLLAVIHGYGPDGWRDPLASQTYLLKNAVGVRPVVGKPSQALASDFGPFPSPRDVISENFSGQHGVIYWTGAAYAWHAEK